MQVTIKNAVRPAIPLKRIVTDHVMRFSPDAVCIAVKVEYNETSADGEAPYRTMLSGDDAHDFDVAWTEDPKAAMKALLQRGSLTSELK